MIYQNKFRCIEITDIFKLFQLSKLNSMELKAATIIGVPEGYIALKASGQSSRQVGQTYRHNSCPLVKANTGKIVCREPMHCLCRI
jgi:hypothetical protein